MTLKFSTYGDVKALTLRDHILPIVRKQGILEDLDHKDGSLRLLVLEQRSWRFIHWTPFNAIALTEAASPGYRHALERQHTRPDLPYGLDVWQDGANVLRLLWADAGMFEVINFVRGAWEDAVLAM